MSYVEELLLKKMEELEKRIEELEKGGSSTKESAEYDYLEKVEFSARWRASNYLTELGFKDFNSENFIKDNTVCEIVKEGYEKFKIKIK